ncbi:MAG: Gfo/Idh/MocA family oxidoreductase, partial [Ruthenibacterium sp.]
MVKIAIIGAGNIAAVHIDAYKMFADQCCITAVCDLFVEKAEECIAAHQLNATAYREIDDLFAHADFDAVSICLPQDRHADIAIKALQCGKHVLVEKPMASSLQECDAMIAAAKASGKVLSVVCQNRFKTPMMKVKQLLENGTIGKVYHTIVNSLW